MKNFLQTTVSMLCACTAMILMTGCAPMLAGVMNASNDEAAVHEKTAKYFGVSTKEITMSSFEKGALSTGYQIRYSGKVYNCYILYGAVSCKQPGA